MQQIGIAGDKMADSLMGGKMIGVFRGFTESNLEFHADLVLPYDDTFNNIPLRGQFVLIQLENNNEAVLGRITTVSSDGKLSYGTGEEYNIRALKDNRQVPEDIKEQYVRYRVDVRVLGNVRQEGEKVLFAPSHRRLPHVGSHVAFPTDKVLKQIAGGTKVGAPIGFYALGEYIYCGKDEKLIGKKDWMQTKDPKIPVNFSAKNLVSRRSFIFSRAGFGKSNLNKLLFSRLYSGPHTTPKNGREVPVGTIIFDRDGEYFWPDDKGRPALCDVPALKDEIVVFTDRNAPSDYYDSFKAGGVRLDIREFKPSDIVSVALPEEKQDQQNVRKLKGLRSTEWEQLVNLIDADGNRADDDEVRRILGLNEGQDAEMNAARANMTTIVRTLHDGKSIFRSQLLKALRDGKLCIVDISRLGGDQALILSGIILRMIFNNNQLEFTAADPKTIPTIAVLEEAQSVLKPGVPAAEPFISWVKEGRKYDLGALMITQQPGSIPMDILSQGDNWFIFHLLSAVDLQNVKKANAHFSDDILGMLLNEPIVGQCVMWSSVEEMSFPISVRIAPFEEGDHITKSAKTGSVETYAKTLKVNTEHDVVHIDPVSEEVRETHSHRRVAIEKAIAALKEKESFIKNLQRGRRWGSIMEDLKEFVLPIHKEDRDFLYSMVPEVLNGIFGPQGKAWETKKDESGKAVCILKNGET